MCPGVCVLLAWPQRQTWQTLNVQRRGNSLELIILLQFSGAYMLIFPQILLETDISGWYCYCTTIRKKCAAQKASGNNSTYANCVKHAIVLKVSTMSLIIANTNTTIPYQVTLVSRLRPTHQCWVSSDYRPMHNPEVTAVKRLLW